MRLQQVATGGGSATAIAVADTAVGIPPEQAERMFDAFCSNLKVVAWDYGSAGQLLNYIEGVCGPPPSREGKRRFPSSYELIIAAQGE